ncbi:hypothetical protein [Geobacter sulfurreducens]|uniref:hypothetical protein n=1 Tax=Geobacter sulfurreducens TaxID=35554 RepID=UPI0020B790CB|nr:hypothetical protein [Geobacter sulfurreducens]UTG93169.1 hypothetical protein J8622_02220 [Geobacter sulfurreducens]
MSKKGKQLTTHEKKIIQALKDRNSLKTGGFTRDQLPYLALDLTLYIANGEMTVALPSLDLGVKAQGITYQELFSEFGDLLDEIAGDPGGLQRKRMNE